MGRTGRARHEPVVDALPQFYPYRDEGCHIHPSCLTCPLPRCIYDEPGWYRRWLREQRDRQILQAWRRNHTTVAELARSFGVSTRTVFRVLQRARRDGGGNHTTQGG